LFSRVGVEPASLLVRNCDYQQIIAAGGTRLWGVLSSFPLQNVPQFGGSELQ
jgi:hypothetical protein